jgi:hypothetical protein
VLSGAQVGGTGTNREQVFLTAYQIWGRLPQRSRPIVSPRVAGQPRAIWERHGPKIVSTVVCASNLFDWVEVRYLDLKGIELTVPPGKKLPKREELGIYRLAPPASKQSTI